MSDTISTEIATVNTSDMDAQAVLDGLRANSNSVVSTFVGDDFDTSLDVFDAVTNAEDIADHLGETFDLANVVAQKIVIRDQASDEDDENAPKVTVVRLVLVDKDGNALAAISTGIAKAVETLFGIVGQPHTWPKPITVKIVQEGSGVRKYFTLKRVRDAKK